MVFKFGLRLVGVSSFLFRPFSSSFSTTKHSPTMLAGGDLSYIDSSTAKAIDETLMKSPGFSLDQLMELAGLSVATAAHRYLAIDSLSSPRRVNPGSRNVLLVCGPGNNGGDGLVAARHLKHFGYNPYVVYPKQSKGLLFTNLVLQLHDLDIPVADHLPSADDAFDLVIDAIFGFSFQGPIRYPFAEIIGTMANAMVPVLSVDIPSGWHVEDGDVYGTGFCPDVVVSLTLPKLCMKKYTGVHYVGGRFMPPKLAASFGLVMPEFGFNDNQIVRIAGPSDHINDSRASTRAAAVDQAEGNSYGRDLRSGRDPTELAVVYVTAPSKESAKNIAGALLQQRLIACANIVDGVTSMYAWEGKVEEDAEVLMIMKTRKELVEKLKETVVSLHTYKMPEVIATPITSGSEEYLRWVVDSTTQQQERRGWF